MQERAQAIGAVLTITSQPGQGTTIEVRLPVSPSVEEFR
jgi:signal transduction histidine kinase